MEANLVKYPKTVSVDFRKLEVQTVLSSLARYWLTSCPLFSLFMHIELSPSLDVGD